MYNIETAPAVQRFFENADAGLQRKIDRAVAAIQSEPRRHNNIKRLKGKHKGYSRFRVGDWRIIFRIEDHRNTVVVTDIAHRSEVYE